MTSSQGDLPEHTCVCCKEVKSEKDFAKAQLRGDRTPRCRSCCRDYQLFHKFGLTRTKYNELLSKQDGCCAICGSTDSGSKNKGQFSVDHCHTSEKVRGLLCTRCNTGLGSFQDNPEFLQSAISYLETVDHEIHRHFDLF